VAAVTFEARVARRDARRLRQQAAELKLKARGSVSRSQRRVGRALFEADRARANRLESRPSPWSELRWTQTYETLEQTLVPLP